MQEKNHFQDLLESRSREDQPFVEAPSYFVNGFGSATIPASEKLSQTFSVINANLKNGFVLEDNDPLKPKSEGNMISKPSPSVLLETNGIFDRTRFDSELLSEVVPDMSGWEFSYSKPREIKPSKFKVETKGLGKGGTYNLVNNYNYLHFEGKKIQKGDFFAIQSGSFWNVLKVFYRGKKESMSGLLKVYLSSGTQEKEIQCFDFLGPDEGEKSVYYILVPREHRGKVKFVFDKEGVVEGIYGISLFDITGGGLTNIPNLSLEGLFDETSGYEGEIFESYDLTLGRKIIIDLGKKIPTLLIQVAGNITDPNGPLSSFLFMNEESERRSNSVFCFWNE